MKADAFDYLVKPISPDELILAVRRALDRAALYSDHQFCKRRLQTRENATSFMIGKSKALQEVKQLIDADAPSGMTVLIMGESGSGKELVARAIHASSTRAERNFVAVDCCTLQNTLFESELFGHEHGAFTGADKLKKGLIAREKPLRYRSSMRGRSTYPTPSATFRHAFCRGFSAPSEIPNGYRID